MRAIMRTLTMFLFLAACGSKSEAPTGGDKPATDTTAKTEPAKPAVAALPEGRDAEAAKLVKAGAACEVKDDDISLSCPERKAAGEYAFQHQQSKEVAATCAELLRDGNTAVKLVAAHCLDRLTSVAVTPVLAHALDSLEAEKSKTVRKQFAWSIKGAEAVTAKLEDRVLALVDKLIKADEEAAAGNVLDTLFPEYMMSSGPKPPKAAQQIVLAALKNKKGDLYIRACDKIRLVEDKAAACKALAEAAVPEDKTDWWRAMAAFSEIKPPCVEQATTVVENVLAAGDKAIAESPDYLGRIGENYELTPDLRKKAAAALTKAKKVTPEWKHKRVDTAIADFTKPFEKKS